MPWSDRSAGLRAPPAGLHERCSADNDDPAQVRVAKLNATGDGWVDAGGGPLNHDPVNGDAQEVAIGTVGAHATNRA
jgi:hypothetical protein